MAHTGSADDGGLATRTSRSAVACTCTHWRLVTAVGGASLKVQGMHQCDTASHTLTRLNSCGPSKVSPSPSIKPGPCRLSSAPCNCRDKDMTGCFVSPLMRCYVQQRKPTHINGGGGTAGTSYHHHHHLPARFQAERKLDRRLLITSATTSSKGESLMAGQGTASWRGER